MSEPLLPEPVTAPIEGSLERPVAQRRRGWWPVRLSLALLSVAAVLPAALTGGIYWSAYNEKGTAWWLTHLPGVTVQAPRGSFMGEFTADQVQVVLPNGSQLQLQGLRWSGLQLSRSDAPGAWVHLSLAQLHVRRLVATPATSPPAAAPTHVRLPLQLSLPSASVDELQFPALGGEPLRALQARVFLGSNAGQLHRIDGLQLQWGRVKAQGSAQLRSDETMAVQAELQIQALFEHPPNAPEDSPAPWSLALRAKGPLTQLDLTAALRSQGPISARGKAATQPTTQLDAQAQLRPFEAWPLGTLQAQTARLDLSVFHAQAPRTALTGHMELRSQSADTPVVAEVLLRNADAGLWNEGRLPLRQLDLSASGLLRTNHQVELRRFSIDLGSAQAPAGRINGQGHLASDAWDLTTEWLAVRPEGLDSRASAMQLSGPLTAQGRWPSTASASTSRPSRWDDMVLKVQAQLVGQLTETPPRPLARATPTPAKTSATPQPAARSESLRQVQVMLQLEGQALQWKLAQLRATAGPASLSLQGQAERSSREAPWRLSARGQLREFDPRSWWRSDPSKAADGSLRQAPSRLHADAEMDLQWPQRTTPSTKAPWLDTLTGRVQVDLQPSQLVGVALQGQAVWRQESGAAATLRLSLDADGNRLRLEGDPHREETPLTFNLDAPQLQRLSPLWRLLGGPVVAGAKQDPLSGALQAQGQVRWPSGSGPGNWTFSSTGTASAQSVRMGPWSLAQGDASWQGSLAANAPLVAQAEFQQAVLPGLTLNRLSLSLKGSPEAHQLRLEAESPVQPPKWIESLQVARGGAAAARLGAKPAHSVALLQAHGGVARDALGRPVAWNGVLDQLQVGSSETGSTPWWRSSEVGLGAEWASQQTSATSTAEPFATRVTVQAGRAELPGAALRWDRLDWRAASAGQAAQIEAHAELESFALAPLLARWQPDFGWGGDLRVGAHLKLKSSPGFEADVLIERLGGDLTVTEEGLTQSLGLSDLRLALNARNGVWNFSQGLAGSTLGVMAGLVVARTSPTATWPTADAPIEGVVELQVANLGAWGTWVPAGWRLGGQLHTSARFGGRFGAPEVTGSLVGSGLSVRNVAEGVAISEGDISVSLQGDVARIERFTAKAGSGTVSITGQAELGANRQAQMNLVAEHFQLLGRVDRRIVTSGQAQLRLTDDSVDLAGRFVVDEGLFDISKGDAPSLGSDVVVIRANTPAPTEKTEAAPTQKAGNIKLDLQVAMGEKLRLRGRGLNTGLMGELRLTSPNNKLAINGAVRTEGGSYDAYGQKLNIDRGLITFTGKPSVARLDIEATRPNTDVRVGVAVTGTTVTPRVRLFSEPDLPDIDKLSWLVLGRESGGLGGTDIALLQRAALGLLAGEDGGGTDQLLRNIGLDSLSLRQSSTSTASNSGETRDTIVSLGKQLSRDWYVGYERSLNATAGNWQLIYRLARRFTLRAQSGLENSLDVIWTWRWQ